jgi:hypothetical protein
METNQLTATELIKATKKELLKARYTNLSLKGIERVWINLEKYLQGKGIDYFSMDVRIGPRNGIFRQPVEHRGTGMGICFGYGS